jgi:GTP:adenosylcobinamide-phosphate guanylyltransferase
MQMRIITDEEYLAILNGLFLKLFVINSSNLPDMDKIIKRNEVYVLATLGTNYQEHDIVDYIKTLKRAIELKCQNH